MTRCIQFDNTGQSKYAYFFSGMNCFCYREFFLTLKGAERPCTGIIIFMAIYAIAKVRATELAPGTKFICLMSFQLRCLSYEI